MYIIKWEQINGATDIRLSSVHVYHAHCENIK